MNTQSEPEHRVSDDYPPRTQELLAEGQDQGKTSVGAQELQALHALIQSAEGRIAICTPEHDCLVAKSMLSALIGLSSILELSRHQHLILKCEKRRDQELLTQFIEQYHGGINCSVVHDQEEERPLPKTTVRD